MFPELRAYWPTAALIRTPKARSSPLDFFFLLYVTVEKVTKNTLLAITIISTTRNTAGDLNYVEFLLLRYRDLHVSLDVAGCTYACYALQASLYAGRSSGRNCVVVMIGFWGVQHSAGTRGQCGWEQGERAAVGGVPRRVRDRVGARGGQAGAQGEPQHQAGTPARPPGAD